MVDVVFQYTYTDVNAQLVSIGENLQKRAKSRAELEVDSLPPASGEKALMMVSLGAGHARVYACKYASIGTPELPHIRLDVGDRRFARLDEDEETTVVEDTIDLVAEIYLATETRPAFVYGMAKKMPGVLSDLDDYPVDASQRGQAVTEINFLTWLSIFPPPLVDTYGREELLSAPAWHVEELDDGSILLVEWADPTVIRDNEVQQHLGFDPEE
jgi:hypothetical protein